MLQFRESQRVGRGLGTKQQKQLIYMLVSGVKVKESESEVAQSCPTLCNPMDCSLSGSSVHGIFQARVLEWIAISFSRGSSRPRNRTQVSRIAGRHFYRLSQVLNKETQRQVQYYYNFKVVMNVKDIVKKKICNKHCIIVSTEKDAQCESFKLLGAKWGLQPRTPPQIALRNCFKRQLYPVGITVSKYISKSIYLIWGKGEFTQSSIYLTEGFLLITKN